MMLSWLLYAGVVAALVSAAAWLAERGARSLGGGTRWVWAAAMMLSVGVPVLAWLVPATPGAPTLAGVPGAYVLETLPGVRAAAGPAALSPGRLVALAWLATTAVLLSGVLALAVRLGRQRRRWRRRVVDGVEVWVSGDTGPAAVGVLRPRVVLPAWALALEAGQRRLMVQHEAEHVRARDPQLALAALAVCVLAPWNLALWWQLRRLRLAIEVDCDGRVLRRSGDPRSYGALLLTVGQRRAGLALALAESRTMLERRLRMIADRGRGRHIVRAVGFLAVAGVALAVACETPAPTDSSADTQGAAPGPDASRGLTGSWTQTAECVAFFLDGERTSREVIEDLAPERIRRVEVVKGEAVPASLGLEPGCDGIQVFTKAGAGAAVEAGRSGRASAESLLKEVSEGAAEPTFTPMTEPPRLENAPETTRALQELYPPLLRDAGIGGTANLWFLIDETGRVMRVRVNKSSGREELDAAALKVAERMEFTPARNGDEPVTVWIALDLTFQAD